MSRYLVVLPDDSAQPILEAIDHAQKSLRIKMFIFSAPRLLHGVIAAHRRGVKVRVMLNPSRRSGEKQNDETRKILTEAAVEVIDSNPAFDVTHEKSMVVDDKVAFVQSLNWETKNLTETRDYAVVTAHSHEVCEIAECFDADSARNTLLCPRCVPSLLRDSGLPCPFLTLETSDSLETLALSLGRGRPIRRLTVIANRGCSER